MTVTAFRPEAHARGARMLRTALGPAIGGWLDDASVGEVMLNPDGRLWIDRLAGGLEDTGERLSAEDGERIIRLVAHHVGAEVHPGSPRVSAELPGTGERFEGLLPPVVAGPAFAIRRPAVAVFTLSDYVAAGIMAERQARFLREAVADRANILVAGGTSTGKTTLVNALLAEVAKTSDRVVLIEDTRELQCAAPNLVALRTKDGAASRWVSSQWHSTGTGHWPAVHVSDAGRLYRLALEAGVPARAYHAVAEAGVVFRDIAEAIGRALDLPAQPRPAEHFGALAGFVSADARVSSALTRELTGWQPSGPTLLADLAQRQYFA